MTKKSAYQQRQVGLVARTLVAQRETQRCARCMGRGWQWHHRRSRRVVQLHRHCPCNGLWLCHICHKYLHNHPEEAQRLGFIVSSHEPEPTLIPVRTWWGWRYHDCDGKYEWVKADSVTEFWDANELRRERSA